MIIDGKKLSEELLIELKEERASLGKLSLGLIGVGNLEDKLGFIKAKAAASKKLDINFRLYELPENLSREKLRQRISQIVRAKTVNGVIIQLPLPARFKPQYFLNAVRPIKDVDCLASVSLGKFYTDAPSVRPPAVEVIDFLKTKFQLEFAGKIVAVVGYGGLIGKTTTHYFATEKATVIILNSQTPNPDELLQSADVIVAGVGQPKMIQICKPNASLIDFGYGAENGRLYGDLDFDKLKDKANLITPTPGGTGPILVAMIFKNLLKLAGLQQKQ